MLYSNAGTGANLSMRTLSIDTVNQKIYFDIAETFVRINYDTANQTPTVLADLGAAFPDPAYITQMTINYATGTVYLGSSSVTSVFGSDAIDSNRVFVATGLTGSNGANSLTFTKINWGANGNSSVGPEPEGFMPLSNLDWPEEKMSGTNGRPSKNGMPNGRPVASSRIFEYNNVLLLTRLEIAYDINFI